MPQISGVIFFLFLNSDPRIVSLNSDPNSALQQMGRVHNERALCPVTRSLRTVVLAVARAASQSRS